MDVHFYRTEQADMVRRGFTTRAQNGSPIDIWLEYPSRYDAWTDGTQEALIILALHHIMKQSEPCHLHAEADAALLENLEEYMRLWTTWRPDLYHTVPLEADSIVSRPNRSADREAISAFSGGVDATYCIYGHQTGHFGRNSLHVTASVLIHGADVALAQTEVFDRLYTTYKADLAHLGIELVPVRTNYRSYPHDWEHCFSIIICAALRLFGGKFSHGTYATDKTCRLEQYQLPWGENPMVDHYESTPWFRFYPAGTAVDRTERCHVIAQAPERLKHLRVCWQHDADGGNCGRCEKCLRTQLNFLAAGYTGPLPFEHEFDVRKLLKMPDWTQIGAYRFRDIIRFHETVSHALPEHIYRPLLRKLERSEYDVHHPLSRRWHRLPLTTKEMLGKVKAKGGKILRKLGLR